jgi:hypothetical protein
MLVPAFAAIGAMLGVYWKRHSSPANVIHSFVDMNQPTKVVPSCGGFGIGGLAPNTIK